MRVLNLSLQLNLYEWHGSTCQESEGVWVVQSDVFMETWLHQDIPDDNISISGLQTVQADQDHTKSGKHEGGRFADLMFSSATTGVILVTLTAKNKSFSRMLNCWLLGSGHIIARGGLTRRYRSCLRDFHHVGAVLFLCVSAYKQQLLRNIYL